MQTQQNTDKTNTELLEAILSYLERHDSDITNLRKSVDLQNANIVDVKRHGEKVLQRINWDHLGKDITSGVAAGVAYELERVDNTARELIEHANKYKEASDNSFQSIERSLEINDDVSNFVKASRLRQNTIFFVALLNSAILAFTVILLWSILFPSNDNIAQNIMQSTSRTEACQEKGFTVYVNPDDGLEFCLLQLSGTQ